MRAYIFSTIIGSFAVDENGKTISFKPFPKDAKKIAEKLKLSEIKIIDEEKQLQQDAWKKGYKEFIFSMRKEGAEHVEPQNKVWQLVRENIRTVAIDKKFVNNQAEFNQLLTSVNLELAKVKIKRAVEKDNLIIQASRTAEELDKSLNVFIERLREWYGLHFPELDRSVDNHEKYAALVAQFGRRTNIDEFREIAQKSMGADLSDEDIAVIQTYATKILELYRLRRDLSNYIENGLREVAPNFTELAGPMLAAKMISRAGGIERLAKMSSSAIQLLGSEKALFRHLHGQGKSPKYGIIFSHPLIQSAPQKHKGKIARLLASKLSIAIKIDKYSRENKSEKLKEDLKAKIKEILSSKD